MRNLARGGLAAILMLGTTGCYWNWSVWPPWQPPTPYSSMVRVNPYPVKVHNDCVRTDRKVDVVHIVVPNVDEGNLHSATMTRFGSDVHGDVREGPVVNPGPTRVQNYETYVDFEGGPYLRRPHDVVLIEVELTDPRWTFMHGVNATVMTSARAHGDMFCIKKDMDVPRLARTVSFYARWVPTEGGRPVVGAYNFVIEDPTQHRRFLLVDPEVRNEG